MKKTKREYRAPAVLTQSIQSPPPVLLLCTGQYNCIGEVGYDCCQPNPNTCINNC